MSAKRTQWSADIPVRESKPNAGWKTRAPFRETDKALTDIMEEFEV